MYWELLWSSGYLFTRGVDGMSKQIVHLEVRIKTICPGCGGQGYIVEEQNPEYEYICQECDGKKFIFKKKLINIDTLKGMLNGK